MSVEEKPQACDRYEGWIALAVGGDLDDGRGAELLHHLDGCPRCRRFAADLEEARDALRRSLVPPDDEAIFARIRTGVRREAVGSKRVLPFRPPGWRRALPALAVAATLVAAVGLYRLERPLPAPPPPVASSPPPVPAPPSPAPAPPSPAPAPPPEALTVPLTAVSAPAAVQPPTGRPSEIWLGADGPSPGGRWLGSQEAAVEGTWLRGEPASEGVAWLGPPAPETPRKIYQDDQLVLYWLADSADEPKEKDDAQPTIL